jgi:hypothetical protein
LREEGLIIQNGDNPLSDDDINSDSSKNFDENLEDLANDGTWTLPMHYKEDEDLMDNGS